MPTLGDGFILAPHDHTPEALGAKVDQLIGLINEKATLAADIDAITQAVTARLAVIPGRSKAGLIGDGSYHGSVGDSGLTGMKALLGNHLVEPGDFLTSVWQSRSTDTQEQARGKATLAALGIEYADAPDHGKATLGTTGATGGYVLPNNLVDSVVKPAVGTIDWAKVVTFRNGVAVRGVDQPFRTGAPTRMLAQDWGATKDNRDEVYGSYTASLVTFAAIYDVAKQYLRFSAGAAEQDVLDEIAKAARLTEEYAILAGPGTGTVGSGDATLGIVVSLLATPTWLGYRSAKTGAASASTIAGSLGSACAEMLGLMAARSRFPNAFVIDSSHYFAALAQGSDTAGFWLSPQTSGGIAFDSEGGLMFGGVPIRHTPNFNAFTGTTKAMLALDGSAFRAYRGAELRIDSSDQAGDRWDKNLVGFRGEMELGFNAETAVHVGAAQWMTAVVP
jgi:HK97 family phage major capsid protein